MDRVVEQLNPKLTNDVSRRIAHFLSPKDRLSLSSVNRQALVDSLVYREGLDIRAKLRRATRRLYVWPIKTPSSDDRAILYRNSAQSVREVIFNAVTLLLNAIQVIEIHDDTTADSVEPLEVKLKEVDFTIDEVGSSMIFESEDEREIVRSQLVELLAVIAPDVVSVSLMDTLTPALYLTLFGEQVEGWQTVNQVDTMNELAEIPEREIRDVMLQLHMWPIEQNFLTKPFYHRIMYAVFALTSVLPNPNLIDAREWAFEFLSFWENNQYIMDIVTDSSTPDELGRISRSCDEMIHNMEFDFLELVPFGYNLLSVAISQAQSMLLNDAPSIVWD
eukprot:scaffold105427_cov34-Tisochrysis_lutea.AAC.2